MIKKQFIIDNKGFLVPFWLFLLIAISCIFTFEQGFFIFQFSDSRHVFTDNFFKYATIGGEEWAFLFVGLLGIFINWKFALKIALLGFLCLIVSALLKLFFAHPRPVLQMASYFAEEYNNIAGVSPHSGYTSFPSGHTMAGFALYAFVSFHTKNRNWQFLLFIAAILVGISRMYLGHHFLKDVILGSMLGYFLAWSLFTILNKEKTEVEH